MAPARPDACSGRYVRRRSHPARTRPWHPDRHRRRGAQRRGPAYPRDHGTPCVAPEGCSPGGDERPSDVLHAPVTEHDGWWLPRTGRHGCVEPRVELPRTPEGFVTELSQVLERGKAGPISPPRVDLPNTPLADGPFVGSYHGGHLGEAENGSSENPRHLRASCSQVRGRRSAPAIKTLRMEAAGAGTAKVRVTPACHYTPFIVRHNARYNAGRGAPAHAARWWPQKRVGRAYGRCAARRAADP